MQISKNIDTIHCIFFKPKISFKFEGFKCFHQESPLIPAGKVLSPAKKTSHSGNPWVSVLISWFLVQVIRDEVTHDDGNKTWQQ